MTRLNGTDSHPGSAADRKPGAPDSARLPLLLTLCATLLLPACGGGGSSSRQSATAATPDGVVSGTVTGFGSIFVGAVEVFFDDSSSINDGRSREDDFRLGQQVECEVEFSADARTARARTARFASELEGPVSAVLADGFEILARRVHVGPETVFERTSLETLDVGHVVEVHGLPGANGELHATRVEWKSASLVPGPDAIEVRGTIEDLTPTRFRLGLLVVEHSSALIDDDLGALEEGIAVEVKSDRAPTMVAGLLVLVATRIERDRFGVATPVAGGRIEIEGFLSADPEPAESGNLLVVLRGRTARIVSSTLFENGTRQDLRAGVKVEIEGSLDTGGVLVARKVSLRRPANIRIESQVDRVEDGTWTLLGIRVRANQSAVVEDDSDVRDRNFSASRVAAGEWVEVRGFLAADGLVEAVRVRRDEPEGRVTLRGPATIGPRDDLAILGVEILASASTRFEDGTLDRDAFLAALRSSGRSVQAKGRLSNDGSILAEELELED